MDKVIITGATSMLGLAMIRQCLEKGTKVYAVIRSDSPRKDMIPKTDMVSIVECGLQDIADLPSYIHEDCDVFYHFAWSHTGTLKNADIKYQIDNIDYTINAIRAAKMLGCRLFVGAGSQAEYGPLDVASISPETPANPRSPYGICKYAAGKLSMIECRRLGIVCVWMRVFSVYGYNDKKTTMIESLLRKMRYDEEIDMTEGIQLWDYLHCDDAASAFYMTGEECRESAVYCLGSGKSRPLREYVEIVSEIMGYERAIHYGAIPYNSDSVMNLCADISNLTEDTGWIPSISFREGIERTIRLKDWI